MTDMQIDTQEKLDAIVERLKNGDLDAKKEAVDLLCHKVAYSNLNLAGAVSALTGLIDPLTYGARHLYPAYEGKYVRAMAIAAISRMAKSQIIIPERTRELLESIARDEDEHREVRRCALYALNACGTRVNLPLSAAAGLELKVPPPKKKASLMPNTTRRIATE